MEKQTNKKITVVFLFNILEENAKSTSWKYSRFFHSSVELPNLLCGGTALILLWQLLPSYNKEIAGFSYSVRSPKQLYIPLRPLSIAACVLSRPDLLHTTSKTCPWTDLTVQHTHICLHTNPKAKFEDLFFFFAALKATKNLTGFKLCKCTY